MAKIKFELRNRANKEGYCSVWLRITNKGDVKRIVVKGVTAQPNQWNMATCRLRTNEDVKLFILKECEKKKISDLTPEESKLYKHELSLLNKNYAEYNNILDKLEMRVKDILDDYRRKGVVPTMSMIEGALSDKRDMNNVSEFIKSIIDDKIVTGHIGSYHSYKGTLTAMMRYDKKFPKRVWQEITVKYITDIDKQMQIDGLMANTRRYYFKSLRAAYNSAIRQRLADAKDYPFGINGFVMPSNSTPKRYLSNNDLAKLKSAQLMDRGLQEAVNIWLFSYYCYGMAIHDVSNLTTDNLITHDGVQYIRYFRQKTKHNKDATPILITVSEPITKLLQWFKDNSKLFKNYLVPIVWREHQTTQQHYYYIKSRNHNVGLKLKKAAQVLNLECENFTSYTSRHSMAMQLQQHQVSREVISSMMGHSDMKTTQIYLDSLQQDIIGDAAKVL